MHENDDEKKSKNYELLKIVLFLGAWKYIFGKSSESEKLKDEEILEAEDDEELSEDE